MGCKIPYNKVINFFAAFTFGVLLYHDHNYFRNVVWQVIIRPERFFDASLPIYVMVILVCIVVIFMIGVIVVVFRRNCVEKLIMRSLPEHKLSDVRSWFKCVFECK